MTGPDCLENEAQKGQEMRLLDDHGAHSVRARVDYHQALEIGAPAHPAAKVVKATALSRAEAI